MSRSKIDALPADIRGELNQELLARNFSDYDGLARWLGQRGYAVSKSSIHRYGSKFELRLEQVRIATEQAEAFVGALPDDQGAVSDATIRLFQEKIFQLMVVGEEGSLKDLAAAGRAVAEVTRASVTIRQERRKAIADAADAAGEIARQQGLTADTAAAIRAAIEGVG